jgi:hypothetical protein
MRMTILPMALLMLTACGGANEIPGGVSADEAAALNDAAVMLDTNSVSANAIDTNQDDAK